MATPTRGQTDSLPPRDSQVDVALAADRAAVGLRDRDRRLIPEVARADRTWSSPTFRSVASRTMWSPLALTARYPALPSPVGARLWRRSVAVKSYQS